MRRFGTAAVVLALALGAAACSDSDNDGAEDASSGTGEEYADAIAAAIREDSPEMPEDDSRCFARSIVNAAGVEELEEQGTPEEVAESDEALSDLALSEDEAEAAYDDLDSCVDPRDFLLDTMFASEDIPDETTACIDDKVDEDMARGFFVALFRGSEGDQQSEDMEQFSEVLMECEAF